jgi:hypothetical protein
VQWRCAGDGEAPGGEAEDKQMVKNKVTCLTSSEMRINSYRNRSATSFAKLNFIYKGEVLLHNCALR